MKNLDLNQSGNFQNENSLMWLKSDYPKTNLVKSANLIERRNRFNDTEPLMWLKVNGYQSQQSSEVTSEIIRMHQYEKNTLRITLLTMLMVLMYICSFAQTLTVSATSQNVLCNGGSDGAISLNVSGGLPPYFYLWSNGVTNQNNSNLSAGVYTATVTDQNGNTSTTSAQISQPSMLIIILDSITSVSCYGAHDGNAYISVSGGAPPYTCLTAANGTTCVPACSPGWTCGPPCVTPTFPPFPGGLAVGVYTMTITDANGCTATTSYTVTAPATGSINNSLFIEAGADGNDTIVHLMFQNLNIPTGFVYVESSSDSINFTIADSIAIDSLVDIMPLNPSQVNDFGHILYTTESSNSTLIFNQSITNLTLQTALYYRIRYKGTNGNYIYSKSIFWRHILKLYPPPALTFSGVCPPVATAPQNFVPTRWVITEQSGCCIVTRRLYMRSCNANPCKNCVEACNCKTDPCCVHDCINYNKCGCRTPWASCVSNLGKYVWIVTNVTPVFINLNASLTSVVGSFYQINVIPNGGYGPYQIISSPPVSPNGYECNVNYIVTVVDSHGCTATQSFFQPCPPSFIITFADDCDSTLCVNVSGGTPPYSYMWNTTPITTIACIHNAIPCAFYTVTITDANGSTITASHQHVNMTATVTNETSGLSNGCIDVHLACIDPNCYPLSYAWSQGGNTEDICNLTEGDYCVTVTDACGNTYHCCWHVGTSLLCVTCDTAQYTSSISLNTGVDVNGNLVAIGQHDQRWKIVNAASNSGLIATPANPLSPFAINYLCVYPLPFISGSNYISPVNSSTYNLNNGFSDPFTFLYEFSLCHDDSVCINLQMIGDDYVDIYLVNSSLNLMQTFTPTGTSSTYPYAWQYPCSTIFLPKGKYYIKVNLFNTGGGCFGFDIAGTITGHYLLNWNAGVATTLIASAGPDQIICPGTCATLTATSTTPIASAQWYNLNTGTPYAGSSISITVCPTVPTCYKVIIQDIYGCIDSDIVCVNFFPGTPVDITVYNACNGGTGGFDFNLPHQWVSISPCASGNCPFYTDNFGLGVNGYLAGTYTITITDANGCSTVVTRTIQNHLPPVIHLSYGVALINCNDSTDFFVEFPTNSVFPYTIQVFSSALNNNPPVQSFTGVQYADLSGGYAFAAHKVTAGIYYVMVIDANGCTATSSITITCNCDTANLILSMSLNTTGFMGRDLNWQVVSRPIVIAGVENPSPVNFAAYSIPAYLPGIGWANALSGTSWISPINQNNFATNNRTVPYDIVYQFCLCKDDSVTFNFCALADDTVYFRIDNGFQFVTPVVAGAWFRNPRCYSRTIFLTQGTHFLHAFLKNTGGTAMGLDISGNIACPSLIKPSLCKNPPVVAQGPTDVLNILTTSYSPVCPNSNTGLINVTATGGYGTYSYNWSNGQTTATVTGLISGHYFVTVTDANGNEAQDSIVLTSPTPISVSKSILLGCRNANQATISLNVSGGTAPYSYSWSTIPVKTTAMISSLKPGSYVVMVTDANGCTKRDTTVVINPAALLLNVSKTNVRCGATSSGVCSINATGGVPPYSYLWNAGAITNSISNLNAGSYSCTVTDAAGCVKTTSATITGNPSLVVLVNPSGSHAATASASGGIPPYAYQWNTIPAQSNATATGLASGKVFKVKVTDSKGCTKLSTVTMPSPRLAATEENKFDVNIFPNPTHGQVSVELNGSESYDFTVTLFNSIGQETFKQTLLKVAGSITPQFDFSAMPDGVYLIKIQTPNGEVLKRLIIN